MATIQTAVDIDIKVDGTQTVQQAASAYEDLGDAVAQTQLRAEELAHQFGINDARTQEAIKAAAQYKQEMEELDFAIEGARGGMNTISGAAQGVLGGFEAAAGAAALMGVESEQLEATLVQLQGAMALSQGIRDFREFLPAIRQTASMIRNQLVTAFSTLRGAIAATGIGLLVVGVGVLIQKMRSLKEATEEASDAQKEYNDRLRDLQTERLALTKGELEALKVQKEAAEAEKKRNDDFIEQSKVREKAIADSKKLGIDLTDSNDEQRRKDIQSLKLRNYELENEIIKFNARIKAIQDQEAAQRQAERDKQADAAAKNAEESFEAYLERLNRILKYQDAVAFDKMLRSMVKGLDDMSKSAEDTAKSLEHLANVQIEMPKKAEIQMATYDKVRAYLYQNQEDIDALGGAISGMFGTLGENNKAFALAQVATDTARALSGALANANSPTPDNIATGGLAGIAKYITLATTILGNAKRARDIIKGGEGATISQVNPSVASFQAPRTFQASTLGQDFSGGTRVYVTEGDITKTQRRVQNNQRVSVIGG